MYTLQNCTNSGGSQFALKCSGRQAKASMSSTSSSSDEAKVSFARHRPLSATSVTSTSHNCVLSTNGVYNWAVLVKSRTKKYEAKIELEMDKRTDRINGFGLEEAWNLIRVISIKNYKYQKSKHKYGESESMVIGKEEEELTLTLDDKELEQMETFKYLEMNYRDGNK
ncbi:hypothetical protein FQA39_LY11099 [Lamprigera yunnana]|nr:hypothetical protein FQA39_LY11099 [Lamprigera yunnana]